MKLKKKEQNLIKILSIKKYVTEINYGISNPEYGIQIEITIDRNVATKNNINYIYKLINDLDINNVDVILG